MPLIVHFMAPATTGPANLLSLGKVRASESIAADATGSLTAGGTEIAYIVNTEAAAVYVAHGRQPNSAATVATLDTSARYAVPAGTAIPVEVVAGDKFAMEAI